MTDEDIYNVDRNAEEATTTTNTLANNEVVPHPPVKPLSKIDKIASKFTEFEENHSQMCFLIYLFFTLMVIGVTIFAFVSKGVWFTSISWVIIVTDTVGEFAWFCYKCRRRRLRHQRDNKAR
ncbi:unnamed protein product [[Candida] boidinii]|uniref:Unnamed protein product n=1 Tax=Candida boidinii TaxID=5477 RepID=A0A9W6TAF6_CANBO|nr:unnamed protein product [[Candida] boidinii]